MCGPHTKHFGAAAAALAPYISRWRVCGVTNVVVIPARDHRGDSTYIQLYMMINDIANRLFRHE